MYEIIAQESDGLMYVGNEMYNFGDMKGAIDIYKQVLGENPNNAAANLMAGICYLNTPQKKNALPYLQKAYNLKPDVFSDVKDEVTFKHEELSLIETTDYILSLLASANHQAYRFDKAIEYYIKYKKDVLKRDFNSMEVKPEKKNVIIKEIERKIYECENGKRFFVSPVGVIIHNIGDRINTSYGEYSPLISADDYVLVFTSRREGSTGENKDFDNEYFEDIYISFKIADRWTTPRGISKNINTDLHDDCVGLAPDGKEVFVFKPEKNGGDIYYSVLKGGDWTVPVSLGKNVNSEFYEPCASITADGKTLYFSSTRPDKYSEPGMYDDLDIFVCKKGKKGVWGEAVRLRSGINSEYHDTAPYILPDGKTLYFSSKGHQGMGGFDIFKTQLDKNGNWSKPQNLGYPVNTVDDDIYFVFSKDGRRGYFSSNREGGYGDKDIYLATFAKKLVISKKGFSMEKDSGETSSFQSTDFFKFTDFDEDNCITAKEVYSVIDLFFGKEADYTVEQVCSLIDYFFEQDC